MRGVSRHWLASAVLFAAFGGLALAVRGAPGWVVGPDARVGALLGGRGLAVAESLSWLASWPVWTTLVVVGGALLWRRGERRLAVMLVVADVSADLLALVSKLLVDRTPPGSTAGDLDALLNGSFFPSGHAVRATVVLGLGLMLLVPRGSAWARAAVPAALALLLALGASRVAVHAHLASDILGGYLLGAAWVELTLGVAPGLSLGSRADERRFATTAGDQPAPG
jgi:undecaprenyl-diphosphatase